MATRDGLAQIWYADANGVITGYTPTADNVASAIIDAYNEHYGTDINIWTPETKTLQVGDTVPNWNAYEKIELILPNFIKTSLDEGKWVFGEIISNVLKMRKYDTSNLWICSDNGTILPREVAPLREFGSELLRRLNNAGYNDTELSSIVVNYEVGDVIPNWRNYTNLPV